MRKLMTLTRSVLGEKALGVGEAHEGVAGVVLVEAGGEDADDGEALVARDEAKRGELALWGGDEESVADGCAEGGGELVCQSQWGA